MSIIRYIDLFLRRMNLDLFMLIDIFFNINQSAAFVNSKFKFLEV